jgi:hypothetical protein
MAIDRDRDYLGDPTNVACAACNQSGIPIRNALCDPCAEIHWFCCECGRILDRDTDLVCTCGFELKNLEKRLQQIEREEAAKVAAKAAALAAEDRRWHRRFGAVFTGIGAVLVVVFALGMATGTAGWVTLAVGVAMFCYGLYQRLVKGT